MSSKENKDLLNNEIKKQSESLETFIENVKNLMIRVLSYSDWATNVSIGLLGFIIAIVIQFRMANISFDYLNLTIVIICLSISIIVGLFVKIKYELFYTFDIVKKQLNILSEVVIALKEKLSQNEVNEIIDYPNLEKDKEFFQKENNKISSKILLVQISTQFFMIIISLMSIVKIVLEYIYRK